MFHSHDPNLFRISEYRNIEVRIVEVSLKSIRSITRKLKVKKILKPIYHGRLIPLFHTGHELPESPRIDFFLIRGDS